MSKPDNVASWALRVQEVLSRHLTVDDDLEVMGTGPASFELARAIVSATAAEREACALLAENFETTDILPFCGKVENECAQVGQEYAGDMLADAIRKRGEG